MSYYFSKKITGSFEEAVKRVITHEEESCTIPCYRAAAGTLEFISKCNLVAAT